MARTEHLPIFLDTFHLTLEIYKTTVKFPHEYKFSLGQSMNRDTLRLLQLIFQVNGQADKKALIGEFLSAFDLVRVELRLCFELKIMSLKRFVFFADLTEKIAKQAQAWRKQQNKACRNQAES